MVRDSTARARIRQHLTAVGPISAASGYATNTLRDAIGYEGSPVAFIQLIAAMDRDQEIVREIKGKRTYSIAAGPRVAGPGSPVAAHDTHVAAPEIDYPALAALLVGQLLDSATAAEDLVAAVPSSQR